MAAVRLLTGRGGHEEGKINVLSFYNGQRSACERALRDARFRTVVCISVDAMQGREVHPLAIIHFESTMSGGSPQWATTTTDHKPHYLEELNSTNGITKPPPNL